MIQWNVSPEIFSFSVIHLRWYSLMFVIGFAVSYRAFKWLCSKEQKNSYGVDSLLNYAFLGTLVGARLGHCLFYDFDFYSTNPLQILAIWNGGLASHGGGIGILIALWCFSKKYPEYPFSWLIDRLAPMVAFTGGLIRIGNLFNSEIIGKATNLPWAFLFTRIDQVPRHPTQIYESLSYFLISLLGLKAYKKYRYSPPTGYLFGFTLSSIFIFRFLWEFLKENQESFESSMILNMGQILSIPFILIGLFMVAKSQHWFTAKT